MFEGPWGKVATANLTTDASDDDLKAIFAYLKTLAPVKHIVDNTEPPTDCPVCKTAHGGGAQNHKN